MFKFLSGKKTYIIAIVGIVYGFLTNNTEIIMTSLLAMGLRSGISSGK